MGIYEELGLQPIINASGTLTRLGGAPMPPAVLEAFCAAAQESVPLDELQAAASRAIAAATGAEAGLVTSGAAGGLMLGAAAILTGDSLARMEQLPRCDFPHEFVVAREQRNGYDHAVRAAGAKLVEVGFNEIVAGAGVRRAEAWEFEAAFNANTAGVFYVYDADGRPPLAEVVAHAHARGLPVLVDAAGELPPRSNLRDIVAAGADLVAFSGGKAIRGPQATGILCGRRDLIAAAALQMLDMDDHFELWGPPPALIDKNRLRGLPRHGIGRGLKVSKEQIVALLTALRLFVAGAYDDELPGMERRLAQIAAGLSREAVYCSPVAPQPVHQGAEAAPIFPPELGTPVAEQPGCGRPIASQPVQCRMIKPADGQSTPLLEITLNGAGGRSALEVCRSLRRGCPPIFVGHGRLAEGKLIINPLHLNDERAAILLRRLQEELAPQ